jgi:hypothetical protein
MMAALFPDAEPRPRKPRVKPDVDPAVKRLVDAFHAKHVERHGVAPLRPDYGRFAKEVKAMLDSATEAELVGLIDDFFVSRDPRVLRTDYLPMDFVRIAQYLRLQRNGRRRHDERTLRDLDAATRATGKR